MNKPIGKKKSDHFDHLFQDNQKSPDSIIKNSSEDFQRLFALSESGQLKNRKSGDSFEGEILSLNKESVFVDTGTPTDGVLPYSEILDPQGLPQFKVGDRIPVVVVRVKQDEIILRYKNAKGAAQDVDNLEDAFDMELPVEGKVLEVIKGGYRVQIQGQKAFCPTSQMDLKPSTEPEKYVGQKLEFILTQYENKGRNIVVSRRKVLEAQKAEFEGSFLQSKKIGDIVEGTITRLEKFGAFVELENGIEGLVHISEIGWSRIQDPSEVVRVGQKVTVKILKVDEESSHLKISLSIKQGGGEGDPWLKVLETLPIGTQLEGTVEKKENFGLFIQLLPGISGLLPRSKWKDSVDASQFENKKRGDKVKVQVDQVMFEDRKISLGLPSELADESWRSHQSKSGGFGSLANAFKDFKKK